MHLTSRLAALVALLVMTKVTSARYAAYLDASLLEGITHVIVAFANSSLFLPSTYDSYSPFLNISDLRAKVDPGTKICLAIGGWGDTAGFSAGCATDSDRKSFAAKVAHTLDYNGFDCVDIDWEFPGGNGEDYKVVPNSAKVSEIQNFPLLLQEIKTTIGDKELSIAAPGREENMMAYALDTAPLLESAVDHIHVMTYDLMNRRDNSTKHQHSLVGVTESINLYLSRGFSHKKLSVGFAFYAGWVKLENGWACATASNPVGCPTMQLELPDGSDSYQSGAITFETQNYPVYAPDDLNITTNGTCGKGTSFKCQPTDCCSQWGACGNDTDYCGVGCQEGYGMKCSNGGIGSGGAPTILEDFYKAMSYPNYDYLEGARYFLDTNENIFWSWDEPVDIAKKYEEVYLGLELGGVFFWSLGEDSYTWDRLKKLRDSYLSDHPRS